MLIAILDAVESRDHSVGSKFLREMLSGIEYAESGGIYIKVPSYSWNWQYSRHVDKAKNTITYSIILTNGMGEDKVKVMDMEVKTTIAGRIKSLTAKYHIEYSDLIREHAQSLTEYKASDSVGTRYIEIDFADVNAVKLRDRDCCLDLLKGIKYTNEQLNASCPYDREWIIEGLHIREK